MLQLGSEIKRRMPWMAGPALTSRIGVHGTATVAEAAVIERARALVRDVAVPAFDMRIVSGAISPWQRAQLTSISRELRATSATAAMQAAQPSIAAALASINKVLAGDLRSSRVGNADVFSGVGAGADIPRAVRAATIGLQGVAAGASPHRTASYEYRWISSMLDGARAHQATESRVALKAFRSSEALDAILRDAATAEVAVALPAAPEVWTLELGDEPQDETVFPLTPAPRPGELMRAVGGEVVESGKSWFWANPGWSLRAARTIASEAHRRGALDAAAERDGLLITTVAALGAFTYSKNVFVLALGFARVHHELRVLYQEIAKACRNHDRGDLVPPEMQV